MDIFHGNCLDHMLFMEDNSVDAIVTDPPYGLSFMGKKWDYDVPGVDIWTECLRVLKPGGHLLAFAGTRTQHRMAVRIEDAGFEIRDMIAWVYGSGFPKSLDVSKALDKAAGAEREVLGTVDPRGTFDGRERKSAAVNTNWRGAEGRDDVRDLSQKQITAPATDAARQWQGWGTALKPALEPITVARKPLIGTVAANVLEHGTGALNIDGCRIGEEVTVTVRNGNSGAHGRYGTDDRVFTRENPPGRWPANLIHDGSDEVVAGFPVTGAAKSGVRDPNGSMGYHGGASGLPGVVSGYDDNGGSAARFFMQCKGDYNDAWQDLNLPQENANTAEQSSSQQRQAAVSALVLAVSSALPEGLLCSGLSMAPFTSATANELRLIAETATQTIQTIGSKFWRESKPARLSLSLNHASDAEIQRLTDTTTITVSRWKSDGSAEPVTFSITPMSLAVGGKDCAPSMDGKRFMYCAKTSKKDRGDGNVHPTVKPTDLMAYLCRLVTPPGGLVYDPFMGSGSTGKAAVREGLRFAGSEMQAEYIAIARARIAAAMTGGAA